MANTHPRQRMEVVVHDNTILALITRDLPEAASQTWTEGAPLKNSSGLFAEWVSVADGDLAAFAIEAAHNVASGGMAAGVLMLPGLFELEANFLGAAAAANVLAAGDRNTAFEIAKSTTLHHNKAGWYILDATSAPIVRISDFATSYALPNVIDGDKVKAGDTDARVRAVPLISKLLWYD